MSTRQEITHSIGPVQLTPQDVPTRVSEYFGENTFSAERMEKMISKETMDAFRRWQNGGAVISEGQADEIADAMKEWAIAKGATSYTHWFQPMTGLTAEKHDSFIHSVGTSMVMERFTGSKLIQGEPDASSFPSGGLRATFEARGYTAWDPSSPAFIVEVDLGKTLCIPSIFVSYTGEALDKKLPLLRSDDVLNTAACEFLKLFGNEDVTKVVSTCGPEQEYFLIDEAYYRLRSDLQLAGRTLLGASSPKGQQLEDQYFGSIKERVLNYMNDVAVEAYKLGIPLTTRHNEVAPHQYEFAPIFEYSVLAADHNQLLMDIMRRIAKRHGLECLLHEKPFAGINGSGKHLNWSLADNNGKNLLNPGDTPEKNLQFLTILVAIIEAVNQHADLLRAAVASAGNEHRLGANEAPPAIISIFLGAQLTQILETIESGEKQNLSKKDVMDLGVKLLPKFFKDTTDRNRTSPFAFTGQKFEFRALGSAMNVSTSITVMNAIIAEALTNMADRIKKARNSEKSFEETVLIVLADTIRENKRVLFEGNNYSDEWLQEAEKRGLANEPSTPKALTAFVDEKNVKLFETLNVFSKAELHARYNIWLDIYNKVLEIEARTLDEIVSTQVLPAAYDFQIEIGNSLEVLREFATDDGMAFPIGALDDRKLLFSKLSADIFYVRKHLGEMEDMLSMSEKMDEWKKADYFVDELKPHMEHIRGHVDKLERVLPDEVWSLPKYREMLFIS